MKELLKQSVGIDCSKDEFAACFGVLGQDFKIVNKSTHNFPNSLRGFNALLKWASKLICLNIPVNFVMEATGVYHEKLAYYLFDKGCLVNVVLPNRAKNFSRTQTVKTITDKEASKMLAAMGLEKALEAWKKPDLLYASLRQLTRERESLLELKNRISNQLHALLHQALTPKASIKRLNAQIKLIEKQVKEIETEIKKTIKAKPQIDNKIKKVCTIKGVGLTTAATIIAETDGFNLFQNQKQLVSYAGYDVIEKQSGTSVRGKSKISKKGNKHIRRALHFPALQAVIRNKEHKEIYERLFDRQRIKMKAYTAIQRKLLVLIYTLWKKDESYISGYINKKLEQPGNQTALTELDNIRPLVRQKYEKELVC